MVNINKKKAFTLAELLVAMLIFAMVASMVIPNVAQNAEKNLFVTQLKKVQNDIQQALLVMMAENQGTLRAFCIGNNSNSCFVEQISQRLETKVLYKEDDARQNCDTPKNREKDACTQANAYLDRDPLLLDKNTPADYIGTAGAFTVANLTNGASVSAVFNAACNTESINIGGVEINTNVQVCGYMEVDTNSSKAPNIVGKDIHYFWIVDKDGIIPFGEIEELSCGNDKTLTMGASERDYRAPKRGSYVPEQLGCTYKLIRDGRILYY